jgi:hypothetical protein
VVVVDQVGNMWEQEEKQTRAGKGVFWVAPPPFIKTFIWWPELLNVFPAGEKSFCLARQKDYPRGHSAKPGGVAIGPPCPAGLSISATNSLGTNETLDARVFLQGFRICRYQGCYMAWCEAL